jgi:hypothetical protein
MRFRKDEPSGWMSLAAATGAALAVGALCAPLLRALSSRIRTPVAAALAPDVRSADEPSSLTDQPHEHKPASKQATKKRPKDPLKKHGPKKHGPKKHEKGQAKKPGKSGKSGKPGPKKRRPRG